MNTTTTITVTRNGQPVTFEHVTGTAWEGQADLRQVTPFKSQSGKTHALRTFLIEGVEIDAATAGLARQALAALREHRAMTAPAMTADEALGDDDLEPDVAYEVRVLWYATNEVETHTTMLPPHSRSLAVHDGAEFYTNRLRREGVRMANFIRTDDGAIIKGARNEDLARVTAREA